MKPFLPTNRQDEKARCFFEILPHKWRLFWAIELISISFCLGLAGVVYVGKSPTAVFPPESDIFADDLGLSWLFFWVNPAVATLFACVCVYFLQWCLQCIHPVRPVHCLHPVRPETDSERGSVRRGAGSYVLRLTWFFLGPLNLLDIILLEDTIFDTDFCSNYRIPLPSAATVGVPDLAPPRLELSCNYLAPMVSHTALFVGLAMRLMAKRNNSGNVSGASPTSPLVSSLLVGWGLGYWAGSLMWVLIIFFPGSFLSSRPLVATIFSTVFAPLIYLVAVLMIADANFLGGRVGSFIEPAAAALKKSDGVLHWTVMTVLRDTVWVWFVSFLIIFTPLIV